MGWATIKVFSGQYGYVIGPSLFQNIKDKLFIINMDKINLNSTHVTSYQFSSSK